jgi:hypothetical protein
MVRLLLSGMKNRDKGQWMTTISNGRLWCIRYCSFNLKCRQSSDWEIRSCRWVISQTFWMKEWAEPNCLTPMESMNGSIPSHFGRE